MNEQTNSGDPAAEQFAAFQKTWTETFARMMQQGFSGAGESAPPEFLRQIRSGILQALAQSWDQFLRSPQFLEGMRQWMDQAMAFRKLSDEFLTRARHETQGMAREDLDQVVLAVQHMEHRLLARMEELTARLDAFEERPGRAAQGTSPAPAAGAARPTGASGGGTAATGTRPAAGRKRVRRRVAARRKAS